MTTATLQAHSISKGFVLAGRALFTVANATGKHYTYKVTRSKDAANPRWWAKLLTGPDNTADYTYIGEVLPEGTFRLTRASKMKNDSEPVTVLSWALKMIWRGRQLPSGYAIHHEGRCCRCGRVLTVPSSVESGIGPECAQYVGG